ncbi:glycosyltransferase family 9 protein [Fundidesulfovibrio agrisoli]|uniref:glycosyltransferase family 9 protein n=1 Tax=Fundidesulfovibrio agrisoli TaxID=2922717 RepID=UPI001FADFF22|nr:glycosyltransferase family 9 protein [Fundidesulfovibrio agrisoli]
MRWLRPLGFEPCPPAPRRALERIHGAASTPEELEGCRIIWPVVQRIPEVAPGLDCTFLPAVPIDSPGTHARQAQLAALDRAGVPPARDWLEAFRGFFGATAQPDGPVLLFPGAGHPAKQCPLVHFLELARMLEDRGREALFVLGPAELERGMDAGRARVAAPQNLEELETLLASAGAVVGGDTGPMHLAGMMGLPGVSLFGPTAFAQWGPVGMREISLGLPCSPCTATCAGLECGRPGRLGPACLEGISPEVVLEALEGLGNCKTGFQGPGIP